MGTSALVVPKGVDSAVACLPGPDGQQPQWLPFELGTTAGMTAALLCGMLRQTHDRQT